MRQRQDSSTTKSVTGSRSTDTKRSSKKNSGGSQKKKFPRKCAKIRRTRPSKGVEKTELRFVCYTAKDGGYNRKAFFREVALFLDSHLDSMQNTVLPAPPQFCPRGFKPCQRSCLKPAVRRSASVLSAQRSSEVCRRQRRASDSELQRQPSVREGGILLVKDARKQGTLAKAIGWQPMEREVKLVECKKKEEKVIPKEDKKEKKPEMKSEKTEKKPVALSETSIESKSETKKEEKTVPKIDKKEEKPAPTSDKKAVIKEVKKVVIVDDKKQEKKEAMKGQVSEKKVEKKEESKSEKKKEPLKPDCHHETGCDNAYAIRTSIPLVEKLIERMAEVNKRRKNNHLAAIKLTAEKILADAVNALYNGGEIGDTVVERITRVSAMARAVLNEPQEAISDVSQASSSNVNACSKMGDSSKSRR